MSSKKDYQEIYRYYIKKNTIHIEKLKINDKTPQLFYTNYGTIYKSEINDFSFTRNNFYSDSKDNVELFKSAIAKKLNNEILKLNEKLFYLEREKDDIKSMLVEEEL